VSVESRLEIDRFTQEQAEALKTATNVGMTPDKAKEYDQRRGRIIELIQEREALEREDHGRRSHTERSRYS